MKKVYITTKDECQRQIDTHPDFVCSSCGGKLPPIETVDNSDRPTYWSGCEPCGHFDYGVRREVFLIAKEMVEKRHHVHYSHVTGRDGTPEEQDYYFKSQIRGTANFIAHIFYVQKEIRQRAMENLLNPAKGAVTHTMNIDPNAPQQEPANQEAIAEQAAGEAVQAEVSNEAATESAAQDTAMGVDSEEGTTEG